MNVIHILGFFVFFQILLMLGYIVLSLPLSIGAKIPGVSAIQGIFRGFSPGFLMPILARFLSPTARESVQKFTAQAEIGRKLYADVVRWTALELSARFALWFQIGAIAGAFSLTVFSDLAFGWSTTLDVAAPAFHQLTTWLALPWTAFAADGVPDLALVEQTQFFRLQQNTQTNTSPLIRTLWWPFIMLCLFTYAFLPRLVLWLLTSNRRKRVLSNTLRTFPGTSEVLARMRTNKISTQADDTDEADNPELKAPLIATTNEPLSEDAVVINWGNAAGNSEEGAQIIAATLNARLSAFHFAGGNRSAAEDDKTVAVLQTDEAVVLLARAWETPTMDMLDFLTDVRAKIGTQTRLRVVLLKGPDTDQRGDVEIWRQMLGRLADPWMKVSTAEPDV